MFIWPQKDGSATYTGSFDKKQWDAWHAARAPKQKAAPAKAPEPKPEPAPAQPPAAAEPVKKAAPARKGGAS